MCIQIVVFSYIITIMHIDNLIGELSIAALLAIHNLAFGHPTNAQNVTHADAESYPLRESFGSHT